MHTKNFTRNYIHFDVRVQFYCQNLNSGHLLIHIEPYKRYVVLSTVFAIIYYAYSHHSVIPSALEPIFTINISTGVLTIDTTGPHLLVQGASGLVTVSIIIQDRIVLLCSLCVQVSVHVADSDYANSGIVSKRKYPMPFLQPPTIVVLSSHNITVGINKHFSYNVEAVSNIGQNVTFQLLNLTSKLTHDIDFYLTVIWFSCSCLTC